MCILDPKEHIMLWHYLSAVFVVKNAEIGDCDVGAIFCGFLHGT